jgi:hypothetical protein
MLFRLILAFTILTSISACSVSYKNVGVDPSTKRPFAASLTFEQRQSIKDLQQAIIRLSPSTIDPHEAAEVAYQAVVYPMHLSNEYDLVWPPALQNVFVNSGSKSRGLCFQWTTDMLAQLRKINPQTLEFKWAIAKRGTRREHNTAVVTAVGEPIEKGIILDPWRGSGNLYWLPTLEDPKYEWSLYKSTEKSG